jgi:rubrerythrin
MAANKTGIEQSPHAAAMKEVTELTQPTSGDESQFIGAETAELAAAPAIGSLPAPPALEGKVKSALKALQGESVSVLVDKLAERLQFERTGTRLYDGLLRKLDAKGGFDGGPSRDELQRFRDEEHQHFGALLRQMEKLGADPTAVTPSANLTGVASMGVAKVIQDARTTLAESLHALLIAELVDSDGWQVLQEVAEQLDQEDLVQLCATAQREEREHLEAVRGWLSAHAMAAAGG